MLILGQGIFTIGAALVFWHWVPATYLLVVLPSLVPALSILLAAVFVRLNRGLPAIDWKSLSTEQRHRLTSDFLALSREYAGVLALGTIILVGVIALGGLSNAVVEKVPALWLRRSSALAGASLALLIARMAYVVWRDIDIVRLQTTVIDAMMVKEAADLAKSAQMKEEIAAGAVKLSSIQRTELRSDPVPVSKF